MQQNYHQPAVRALLDALPVPVITFDVGGRVTFANRAAKSHPGQPAEVINGLPVIRSLSRDISLGKVKLPYAATLELKGGMKVEASFLNGLSGLDTSLILAPGSGTDMPMPGAPKDVTEAVQVKQVMALVRDELIPPMQTLMSRLMGFTESAASRELESAVDALKLRLNRLHDLVKVFGNDVLHIDDRIEIPETITAVCDEIRPRAVARGVHIEITPPPGVLPPLYGNAEMIRRALYECIDNAVTHSRREVRGGAPLRVTVAFNLTGEHVLVVVRNEGALPPEQAGIETRDALKTGGGATQAANGRLGLPLVERILGLHGGNLRISASGDDEVRVLMEFPTGAPQRGQSQMDIEQAQRYAHDLAQLMKQRKNRELV